ncbi:serine/threonine protein kinase [Desulfonema ishimotonii]|uniref:Serine/threonine protein kinase n=1 Tax=Desulfonema ishimotonii TaxID=45657 RepID=A0A401FRY2_9BACT|nr:hypothetical protein [Desulfonema ishimotonii]GBC59718.1 serine/threonine protein kinase [Desulfonema ishimotonii]
MKKRISGILFILIWCALICRVSLSCAADPADYDYPFENPVFATIAGSPPDENLSGMILKETVYGIEVFKGKRLPPTMRNLRKYRFSTAWQSGEAPLIFIIPGTGSNYKAGNARFLQKIFYDEGFHVIVLNSPFSRRFAAMGSASAIPGISEEDARDLYYLMQQAYEAVYKDGIRATDFYLTGYSLGGLNAAFVSRLDGREKFFNFRKVLMINPPVDLFASTKVLDDYVTRNLRQRADIFFDNIFRKVSRYFEYKGDVYIDGEFLYDVNRIAPLTQDEMEGLIGVAFRLSLASVVFSADMLTNGGYVKKKGKIMTTGASTTPYFKEVLHWTFMDYLDKVLLPYWQKRHPGDNRETLISRISLKPMAGYLRSSAKIGVVHNADDIILTGEDLAFIRETFGDRARIYPRGGHLGNMLYGPNVEYMVNFFKE